MAFGLSIATEHGVNSGLNKRRNEFGSDPLTNPTSIISIPSGFIVYYQKRL